MSYYTDPLVQLLHGDCIEVMAELQADSVDAVVTDPPYGLEFMGKGWDKFGAEVVDAAAQGGFQDGNGGNPFSRSRVRFGAGPSFQAWCEQWGREALRVTKPGGYLLAFGGTRTHHRLVCALEDAGWIIRDELDWIYASGFPKGKANLKPAHEPIVLARKPGPLRPLGIDECRIETVDDLNGGAYAKNGTARDDGYGMQRTGGAGEYVQPAGRWPSNVLLSDPELFDEPNPYVVGSGATAGARGQVEMQRATSNFGGGGGEREFPFYGDSGGYSRFFAIPKRERGWHWCQKHDRREHGKRECGHPDGKAGEREWCPLCDPSEPSGDYPTALIIPKADRAERERGLESLALMLHRERGECDKLPAWESADRSPSDPTASTSPVRAISEGKTRPTTPSSSSDTSALGSPSTGQSPTDTRSTTSTGTRRTTRSTTSSSSIPSVTSESTPGASLSMGFGGSPAESADSFDPSPRNGGTSPEKAGPSTDGADPATSARWSSRNACADCGKPLPRGSSHPTVKPIDLMRHLVRLVCPPGGQILDPFLGSGTTALAASEEGFRCIGIERELEYLEIAKGRLMATPMGLGLDVPAPTQRRAKLGKDTGGGTHCSFFPGKCEGHPGHGKYGPTIHVQEEPAA
jgi:DNA modification methylase